MCQATVQNWLLSMLSGEALLAQRLDRCFCKNILQHLAVDCANRLHAYDAQRRCHCHSLGRAPQGEGQGCKGSCNYSQQGTSDARQLSRHCTSGCGGGCGVCCGRGRPQAQDCCHPNREWADPPGEMAQCLLCQLWHLLWVWCMAYCPPWHQSTNASNNHCQALHMSLFCLWMQWSLHVPWIMPTCATYQPHNTNKAHQLLPCLITAKCFL